MDNAPERILNAAYAAFNARDLDAAIELMHPEVDWPNAWEGGRAIGREAVLDYWSRQYRLEGELIVRMDVLDS